ncbi:MAG TPA: hypothetical protein VED01_23625 [Burkholderiales bacterium]|nr:hypothetical protein [Burkholderiales bacterium]
MRLLDPRFKYTPSMSTDIVKTWKRHGFKPTSEAERLARQRRAKGSNASNARSASVTPLSSAKRKLRGWNVAAPKVAGADPTT